MMCILEDELLITVTGGAETDCDSRHSEYEVGEYHNVERTHSQRMVKCKITAKAYVDGRWRYTCENANDPKDVFVAESHKIY